VPTYNTVSVTGNNIFGNSSGEVVNVTCAPHSLYFDTVNNLEINAPTATATSNNAGAWTLTNLIDPTPAGTGMAWTLTVTDKGTGQTLYSSTVQIAFANGASQQWLALTPPPAPATTTTYLVTPGAVPGAAGQFLTSFAANSNVLAWNYGMNPLNVLNFMADPTGVTDSTTAINNAIAAATGNAAPSTHSRVPTNSVYLPTGTYKVSADLLIQSVVGFHFFGDGPEMTVLKATGTAWTNAVLVVDGSYAGRYEGFTILGDTTEQVTNGIMLTYTTGAARSTTGNKFADIRVRNLNHVNGFNMAGVTNRQLDSTRLDCVVVGGNQVPNAWSNSGNWQQGFVFGNGTFANIYDQVLSRCDPSGYYYGFYNNVSSFMLSGSQPANNYCDFYMNPGAQCTISNVQSQNAGYFIICPSNFAPEPVTFNDCQMKSSYMQDSADAVIKLGGGTFNINNFSAAAVQVTTSVAAGSNGGQIANIATWSSPSAGILDVASTNGMASSGTMTVATSTTTATITYTGLAGGNQLTGCVYVSGSPTGTVSTGGQVNYYQNPTISVVGSSASRPCFASFSNLCLRGTRVGAFTPLTNAVVTVQNYSNYEPTTGLYTQATGDPLSINIGGNWSSVTGVVPPQVNFISATGNTQYTVPAGAQTLDVTVVGGGSGGASGALATSGNAGGGSGGGGGGYSRQQFQASQIASPLTVSVGAGGNGGAAVSSAGAGNVGQAGGSTLFGGYLWAHGASAQGAGGNATNGATTAGATGGAGMITGSTGAATVTTAAPPNAGASIVTGGGGAGGGINTTAQNGSGGAAPFIGSSANSASGGVVGGASPTNGAAIIQGDTAPGAGGGAAALSGTAQNGANGQANSGAGGGGGGACSTGTSSGAGGNGGSGFCLIIAYFQ
jgi:hypothetical protein